MRQIKFRGKCVDNGEFFYGYLIQKFSNFRVAKSYIYHNLVMHEVDPESVQQLIAVDGNGREVYEGDLVERIADYDDEDFDPAKAFPMAATFDDFSAINDGQIIRAEAHHDD